MSAVAKISVTIDKGKLCMLRKRAKRLHGGKSAVIDEATEHLRGLEALDEFLDHVKAPKLSPEELEQVHAEWRREAKPKGRRRPTA